MTTMIELGQLSGICMMSATVRPDLAVQLLEAVTGWTFDPVFQQNTIMRTMNMRHAFNLREGQTPSDFVLPKRSIGEPPQKTGPLKDVTVDHKKLAENFFAAMEWDLTTGKPSRKTLEALGGMEVAGGK